MNAEATEHSTQKLPPKGSLRALARVSSSECLGGMVLVNLKVPGWTQAAPGQFALLQAVDSGCFLARAFSVCRQSGEAVSFLVAPIGQGTRELTSLAVGSSVWVLGPLGNCFDMATLASDSGRLLLVGGGVGIAPFPLAIADAVERSTPAGGQSDSTSLEVLVLAGFRDSRQARGGAVLAEAVKAACALGGLCTYESVVEDGSQGEAVRVTDLLAKHLKQGDRVAVCGPEAMAQAVWRLCSEVPGVQTWFSLETHMACGVGSCHGCVIELADGSYTRVCREGPVFAGEEVFGGG